MKVRYTGQASDVQVNWGGNDDPRKLLTPNETYRVEKVEEHSYHTKYHIRVNGEIKKFNTVHFELVKKEQKMKHFGIGASPPTENEGKYKKRTTVTMWLMNEPFTCSNREGKKLKGQAGDFIAEDGHGGFYPVSAEFHANNYESAE